MNSNFDEKNNVETTEGVPAKETKKSVAKKETPAKAIKKNIYQKLFAVQQNLKASKGQYNEEDHFKYRSAEDILEAVKPHLAEQNAIILLTDKVVNLGGQVMRQTKGDGSLKEMPYNYIEATAKFIDIETGETIEASADARECEHLGMSADQCSGCASSYARKYALNGLLCIDNTADSDSNEVAKKEKAAREKLENEKKNTASPTPAPWGNKRTGSNGNGWGR